MAAPVKAFYFEILSTIVYRVTKSLHGSKTWEKTKIDAKGGPDWTDYESVEEYTTDFEAWELARDTAAKGQVYYHSNSYNNYGYSPTKLFDGVDHTKFRRTWLWLLRFHFSADYHKETKYVSEFTKSKYIGRRPYEEA